VEGWLTEKFGTATIVADNQLNFGLSFF